VNNKIPTATPCFVVVAATSFFVLVGLGLAKLHDRKK
jgi:hypothetical protein